MEGPEIEPLPKWLHLLAGTLVLAALIWVPSQASGQRARFLFTRASPWAAGLSRSTCDWLGSEGVSQEQQEDAVPPFLT